MLQLRGHEGEVSCVAFSPDGRSLASAGADKVIRLWQAGTDIQIGNLPVHDGAFVDLTFSPDSQMLFSCDENGAFQLWDVARREVSPVHSRRAGVASAVAFSPDGKRLAGSLGRDGQGGVILWNSWSKQETYYVDTYAQPVHDLSFSADSRRLAIGLEWSGVGIRDLVTGRQWALAHGQRAAQGAWVVRAVAFSPDGKTLAAGTREDVELWEVLTGRLRQKLTGHGDLVLAIAYSADSRVLISGGKDDCVRVWNAQSGALIEAFDWQVGGIRGIAITPDGTLAAACGNRGLVVWDLG